MTTAIGLPGTLAVASGQAAETIALVEPRRLGRPHRVVGVAVRRHVQPAPLHAAQGRASRSPSSTTRRTSTSGAAVRPTTKAFFGETLANPKNDVFDIEAIAAVAHADGHPPDRRQHGADALSHPPDRVGRRRRGAQPHQVPRWPRQLDRRRDHRRRQLRLRRLRPLPQLHRARPQLPRVRLLAGARAGVRSSSRPACRCCATSARRSPRSTLPDPPGHRDAEPAHGTPLRERPDGRRVPRRPPDVAVGQLRRPARQPLSRAGAEVRRRQGLRLGAGVRDRRRARGRQAASSRRCRCTATSRTSATYAAWSSTRRAPRTASSPPRSRSCRRSRQGSCASASVWRRSTTSSPTSRRASPPPAADPPAARPVTQ